jgi:hypothetical protein
VILLGIEAQMEPAAAQPPYGRTSHRRSCAPGPFPLL